VLELSLAEELDVEEGREAEGVEANIADHVLGKLSGRVGEGNGLEALALHLERREENSSRGSHASVTKSTRMKFSRVESILGVDGRMCKGADDKGKGSADLAVLPELHGDSRLWKRGRVTNEAGEFLFLCFSPVQDAVCCHPTPRQCDNHPRKGDAHLDLANSGGIEAVMFIYKCVQLTGGAGAEAHAGEGGRAESLGGGDAGSEEREPAVSGPCQRKEWPLFPRTRDIHPPSYLSHDV
jgi:hypothetical protein